MTASALPFVGLVYGKLECPGGGHCPSLKIARWLAGYLMLLPRP